MKNSIFFVICFALFSCQHKNNKAISNTEASKTIHTKESQSAKKETGTGCSYDNDVSTLGIGLVIAPSKVDIYNDSQLTNKSASYDMYKDGLNKISICPKFYEPDYGIMHFVCIDSTEKAYKVLINYDELKYLPKTKDYVFKSWQDYINESYGIRRLTAEGKNISKIHLQPLRKSPVNEADTLVLPAGYEMFCPVEIKGDWLRVKFDCFYNDDNNKHEGEPCRDYIDQCKNPVSGWLKWKDGNKLLVDILTQL